MNSRVEILRAAVLIAPVVGATVGRVDADVEIDPGRGPVTVHVPTTYDPTTIPPQ